MPEVNFNLLAPSAELYSGPQVQMDPVAAYEKAKATRQSNMLAQLYAKHYDPQTGGVNYNALIGEAAQTGLNEAIPSIMGEAQKQAKSLADIAQTQALQRQQEATAAAKQQEIDQAKMKQLATESYGRFRSVKNADDLLAWHLANPELPGTNKAERTARLQAQLAQPGGYEAARSEIEAALQDITGIKPKEYTPTELEKLISLRNVYKVGTPERNDLENKIKLETTRAPAASTNITVKTGEEAATAFSKELGQKVAGELDTLNTKAQSAKSSIETSQLLRPLLENKDFISGTLGDTRLAVAKALGLSGADETQAFFAGIGKQVAENIKAFGSGTAVSDTDLRFAQSIVGGSKELTPSAIKQIMELNDKYSQMAIDKYNSRKKFLSQKNPTINDYYEDITSPSKPAAGGSEDIKSMATSAFGSYEPNKYEYRVNPSTGKVQRKAK